ncbi:MAG: HD domain-containing protein, partial [Dehalococcoidia bacterium]|nr:HD domain-containing protein [Dehalococcoidia bacterium]
TLVEARDTDAGAHLHRIQHFSRALALHLGFSERDAQEIAYASMLHDVGKANVPDAILKKSGPLTPDEWRIMQDHTNWGDHLLTENSDFEMARQVARWHHEHWDGTGYPDRLKGDQIPFVARIVGVADVYDALISKRPYKEPWPPETALRELQLLAGSHLDARLVDAFIQLWEAGVIERITQEMGDASSDGQAPIERAA